MASAIGPETPLSDAAFTGKLPGAVGAPLEIAANAMPRTIVDYVFHSTGKHQAGLAIFSIAVFLLSTAPLELQRRIVNAIVRHDPFEIVLWLALAYSGVALTEQSLKLGLNVYRGWVAENAVRTLRFTIGDRCRLDDNSQTGIDISMILEEVEPIGGFTGISVSEPLLQGGILVSVIGYMLYLNDRLAVIALAFFLPQLIFVPLLQGAINRRAQARILTKRSISGGVIDAATSGHGGWQWAKHPIEQVFAFNMGIYKLKFSMNLLMNLMHHCSVAVALGVGGWMVLQDRIDIGTVVAIVSGLGKLNDPWGDLVSWARELSVVNVKYKLLADMINGPGGPKAPPP